MNDQNQTVDEPGREQTPDAVTSQPERIGRYQVKSVLGKGGFGVVYLAHDEQLQRLVAIKVPHARLISRPEDAEAYLIEARTVASLDHPNLVPVYDVGSTQDFPCFVVSKFIEGSTLSQKIKANRDSVAEAVDLVAIIAETLNYAHRKGLVHRDIKPGNILLDASGKPFVADFGLALREQDVGKGPRYAGTPAYMSPEQARGEGHRVDGRSDIFSLGVVFYELVVGRQPFRANSQAELLEQVTNHEPRPLRQMDEGIPKEVERICFKALAKRAAERYMTAQDMADDLRYFLARQPSSAIVSPSPTPTTPIVPFAPSSVTATTPTSDHQPIKIVPKGLRSFDAHDADFFLELLPGPRDRDGLPDSLRFWKTRIEETDADNTLTVGLIYGPSGCGKSSLVKAGLLPRLSDDVIAVYVEATSEETEIRFLNGLRKRCPALADDLGLKETLAALRRGQGIPVGKKVVIVLDQFEQWLHAKKEEVNTELVQALRQCDGGRVQCIVMVRDDFWLAVSRFLRELEVRLVEGQNSALVDLFPLRHAEKVLAAFGRAFGVLPENPSETSKDQKHFLEQAVSGLAQEGKVNCVRLALFAEMMKGNAWSPASLRAVGGTEGVGVTFLEKTFSAATAPPGHRYHQKAARANLKVLLPESGSDIKGHMRSYAELLEASGYGSRPKDFDDLLRILDNEIRLITPTDPKGKDADTDSVLQTKPGQKYYQLTHDYLVHSLREWLTRKQKETRRGRAELLLADRAAVWSTRPENRQLPSLLQWFNIRWWTHKKNWTPPQKKMMAKAGRYHAVRGMVLLVVLALVGWGGYEGHGTLKAHALRDRLLDANTNEVPTIVDDMGSYRRWINPLLHDAYGKAEADKVARKQLHASLALLPVDATQVTYLYERLLNAAPHEVPVIRDALAPHKDALLDKLWVAALTPDKGREPQRLRAAAAVAKYDPESEKWSKASGPVVEQLVGENPVFLGLWMDGFRPIKGKLSASLANIYRDTNRRESERTLATNILADYAADKPQVLADLLMDADEKQFAVIYPKVKDRGEEGLSLLIGEIDKKLPPELPSSDDDREKLAKRQANAAVALLRMNQPAKVWPLLKHSPDPRVRSYLIHRLGPLGADATAIVKRLEQEPDITIRRALILSLGEVGERQMPSSERPLLIEKLLTIYEYESDAGLHGAAEWLLHQWGQGAKLKVLDDKLRTSEKQLYTVLKAQQTEEHKTELTKLAKEIEEIQNRFTDCEKGLSIRQAMWEQTVREQPLHFPPPFFKEGLIAHYPLDDALGQETFNAVTGQPGAIYQGDGMPEWVQGVIGRALRLDGSGTVVGGKALDLECGQAFSYGCWFQYSAKPPMILIASRDSTKGHRGFELSIEDDHHLRVQIAGEEANTIETKREPVSPHAITVLAKTTVDPSKWPGWHHVLVTYDGLKKAKGVKIFVDGKPQTTVITDDRLSGTIKSDVPVHIGSRHGGFKFRGDIDDVRIYKRRIDEKEVQQLYESGIQALVRVSAEDRTTEQRRLLTNYYRSLDGPLRQLSRQIAAVHDSLQKAERDWIRRWYVNGQGQTMVVIPGPAEFTMGSPATEKGRNEGELLHKKRIGRTFAIAAKPVTLGEYRIKTKDKTHGTTEDCPVVNISWHEAAAYCNWLSVQEGLSRDQWCYETNEGEVTNLKSNYLSLTGYRLPTETEMEYAIRAGAVTSRYYGETDELLGKYGWHLQNADNRSWPVGSKKPNDLGLFDMHGNVWCWCQESHSDYRQGEATIEDKEDTLRVNSTLSRVLRGGSLFDPPSVLRSAFRNAHVPTLRFYCYGFRVARTLPVDGFVSLPPTPGRDGK